LACGHSAVDSGIGENACLRDGGEPISAYVMIYASHSSFTTCPLTSRHLIIERVIFRYVTHHALKLGNDGPATIERGASVLLEENNATNDTASALNARLAELIFITYRSDSNQKRWQRVTREHYTIDAFSYKQYSNSMTEMLISMAFVLVDTSSIHAPWTLTLCKVTIF
jgi:hypothetical protein